MQIKNKPIDILLVILYVYILVNINVLSLLRDECLLIHSIFLQELKTKELVINIWFIS